MKKRYLDEYRRKKIALRLCVLSVLQMLSPLSGVLTPAIPTYADTVVGEQPSPTSTQTVIGGGAVKYETVQYNFEITDNYGNTKIVTVTADVDDIPMGDGSVFTTHTLDLEAFETDFYEKFELKDDENRREIFEETMRNYYDKDTGTYDLLSTNTTAIRDRNTNDDLYKPSDDPDFVRNANDWSSGTDYLMGLPPESDKNPLYTNFHLSADEMEIPPTPTNTPVPTEPPTPKPTNTPIPTNVPIPTPEVEVAVDTYTVITLALPEEGGSVSGEGEYPVGAKVSSTATANPGYYLESLQVVGADAAINSDSASFTMPSNNVIVVARFQKEKAPEPDATATPTPKPPTPTPTPAPQTYHYYPVQEYVEYGSTTNGYSVSDITVNGKIADETGANAIALADEIANVGEKTEYVVGRDGHGNEWYFMGTYTKAYVPSVGYTVYVAKSVHPKTYNGHAVDSSDVRFINELVFPERIEYNGRTYYVYTIGGSGPYYYSNADTNPAGTVSSSLGQITGSYSWKSGSYTSAFSYELGVIGNGTITSSGTGYFYYKDYDTYAYHPSYKHDYHIYNTTLTSVTIPASCITIEDYAFRNCQALTSINIASGGSYLTTIGTHSFSVSEIPELQRSRIYTYTSKYISYKVEKIYSYNGSYVCNYKTPFNESMKEFQRQLEISSYMEFPAFSKLQTIGESAFENRYHLQEVGLYSTVATIHQNAFKNCKLEKISVPNRNCVVNGNYHTLGTKGSDYMRKTLIITPENSKAHVYGTTWNDYYMLSPNIYINYLPNGGTPNATQTVPANAEYKSVKWSDQMATDGTYVVWVDDEYNVYWAKGGSKISGKIQTNLTSYKFVSIVFDETFNKLLATTKTGVQYFLGVSSSGVSLGSKLPFSLDDILQRYKSSNTVFLMLDKEYRIHYFNSSTGVMYSEPVFPKTVKYATFESGKVSSDYYVSIYRHDKIICEDGTAYKKQYLDSEWNLVPFPDGVTSWTNFVSYGSTHYLKGNNGKYYIASITSDGVTVTQASPRNPITVVATLESIDYSKLGSASSKAIYSRSMALYDEYYQSSASSSSSSEWQGWNFAVYPDKVTVGYEDYTYSSTDGYDYAYDLSGTCSGGFKTFLGATADYSSFRALTLSDTGYLESVTTNRGGYYTYGDLTISLRRVSDIRFEKCVMVSYPVLHHSSGDYLTYCTSTGCLGHSPESSSNWWGSDYYTPHDNGVIFVLGLDTEGYLYTITADTGSVSVTKYSDEKFLDILCYQQESSGGNMGSSSGTKDEHGNYNPEYYTNYSYSTITSYVYALGGDHKIYSYSKKVYDYSSSDDYTVNYYYDEDGNIDYTTHSSADEASCGIPDDFSDFAVTLQNYVNVSHNHTDCSSACVPDNVGRLLEYPYFQFEAGEIGYLPRLSCPLDIDAGFVVHYDISENEWFTKTGYECNTWNTQANGKGTTYLPNKRYSVLSTTTTLNLYAQWTGETPKPKYVYYDANGGYGTMNATVIPAGSSSFKVAANGFAKSGHSFKGYFTEHADGTGNKYYPGQTYTTDKNKTILYAQWSPYTYTVSFAYDNIRVKPEVIWDTVTLTFDQSIGMPKEPYEKKCVVDYDLNTNSSMSTAASARWTTPYPFSEDYTTVYMKFTGWHKYRNIPGGYKDMYLVYEEFEEVSGLSTVNGDHLTMFPEWGGIESYVCLPGAVCNGYELFGYMDHTSYEDSNEFVAYIPENGGGLYLPKQNETLYARWLPKKYTVKLVSDFEGNPPDTTGDTSVVMTFDEVCPDVTAPTLEHYVFMGYYTKPDGQGDRYYGKADEATRTAQAYVDEDGNSKLWQIWDGSVTTLYAYWVPDKEIRYEPNYTPLNADCKEAWSEFIETDDAYWTLAENEFTRTGYHFTGWNTVADGSGISYADKETVATADIDGVVPLYAQWEPNKYTVQYAPDEIGEHPVIPEPGPGDIWEYDKTYTISGQPFEKHDRVSYDLNRADKSTVPELLTMLADRHTKSVYRFVGWQLYEKTAAGYVKLADLFTAGEKVINLTAEEGKAYVLFPVWKDVPDGVTLPSAKCTGYDFHGWTETRTADSMLGSGSVLASPYLTKRTPGGVYTLIDGHKVLEVMLYAYWTPKQYVVILDDRGATSTGHTESVVMTFDEYGPDIIVPEKTGYVFRGYYTGIRGTGTKYYDETGTCIRPWTEDNVYVLYACWVQEEVKLPDIGDRTPPEELPELDVEGNVGRTDGKGLLYADDYNPATNALTDLQPYLTYDTPGSEGAIPGTEFVAFRAKMGSWMLSYKFHRYSGTDYVRVYVAVPYRTQYEKSDSEKLVISPVQTKTYSFLVPKAWSYWEVLESGMYYPDKVDVYNDVLKDGSLTVEVDREGNGAVETPDYFATNHGEKENHVFWKDHDTDGTPVLYIILTDIEYIISNVPDTLPDINKHLKIVCENAAWKDERQASVKSDSFIFDGEVLLSDELNTDGNGSALEEENLPKDAELVEFTSYLQTYASGIELDERKPNDTYSTKAVITYVGDDSNVGAAATKEVELADINAVKIHTPVACEGVAVDGIEDGVITLKDALNFFTLRIDNTGTHRMSLGYGTKDFAFALSGKSNVAEQGGSYLNQVRFPFDVYVDMGNNSLKEDGTYDTTGDYYFEAGTWLTMGMEEQRFYIPVSQTDGEYCIDFKTIAVNCPMADGEYLLDSSSQEKANKNHNFYVVTDSMIVNIELSAEKFDVINTNDPAALELLKKGTQSLVLKKGYKFAYKLTTFGAFILEDAKTRIVPTYYYISTDGAERSEVELYYNEVVNGKQQNFIVVGGSVDVMNVHKVANDSVFLSIPSELLEKTQNLLKDNSFIGSKVDMYTYSGIMLNRYTRMFLGIDTKNLPLYYCNACYLTCKEGQESICGHSKLKKVPLKDVADTIVQEWYGEFALPAESYVIVKDTITGYCDICKTQRWTTGGKTTGSCGHELSDMEKFELQEYVKNNTISGDEEFFKKTGYIAISFDIQVKADGNRWYTFEKWTETELYKGFSEKPGYVPGDVIWYDLSKTIGDDYEVGGAE